MDGRGPNASLDSEDYQVYIDSPIDFSVAVLKVFSISAEKDLNRAYKESLAKDS